MTIGENRNKVYNIVKPNLSHFHKLYYPILQTFESVHISPNSSKIQVILQVIDYYVISG